MDAHGHIIGKGDHNHIDCSHRVLVIKTGQLIMRNSKHVKMIPITADKYLRDQLYNDRKTDTLQDILKTNYNKAKTTPMWKQFIVEWHIQCQSLRQPNQIICVGCYTFWQLLRNRQWQYIVCQTKVLSWLTKEKKVIARRHSSITEQPRYEAREQYDDTIRKQHGRALQRPNRCTYKAIIYAGKPIGLYGTTWKRAN